MKGTKTERLDLTGRTSAGGEYRRGGEVQYGEVGEDRRGDGGDGVAEVFDGDYPEEG